LQTIAKKEREKADLGGGEDRFQRQDHDSRKLSPHWVNEIKGMQKVADPLEKKNMVGGGPSPIQRLCLKGGRIAQETLGVESYGFETEPVAVQKNSFQGYRMLATKVGERKTRF